MTESCVPIIYLSTKPKTHQLLCVAEESDDSALLVSIILGLFTYLYATLPVLRCPHTCSSTSIFALKAIPYVNIYILHSLKIHFCQLTTPSELFFPRNSLAADWKQLESCWGLGFSFFSFFFPLTGDVFFLLLSPLNDRTGCTKNENILNRDVSGNILPEIFWNMLKIKYIFIKNRHMLVMNRVLCI